MLDDALVAKLENGLRKLVVDPDLQDAINTISGLQNGLPTTKDGMRALLRAFRRLEFSAHEGIDCLRPLIYYTDNETTEAPTPEND